jgi:hypothetical protein
MRETVPKIQTPFGEYAPRLAGAHELAQAAALLGEALEAIARVNHDRWAAERIAQGWRYGAQRDEARKLHPDLVPYEHLSGAEKRLDAEGAKAIVAELIRLGILRP